MFICYSVNVCKQGAQLVYLLGSKRLCVDANVSRLLYVILFYIMCVCIGQKHDCINSDVTYCYGV